MSQIKTTTDNFFNTLNDVFPDHQDRMDVAYILLDLVAKQATNGFALTNEQAQSLLAPVAVSLQEGRIS
jgi:hypothetical protein